MVIKLLLPIIFPSKFMNPIALIKSARELAGLFIMSYWFPVSFITGSELTVDGGFSSMTI